VLEQYQAFSKLAKPELNDLVQNALRERIAWASNHSVWWRNTLGEDFLHRTKALSLDLLVREVPILTKTEARRNSQWMQVWIPGSKQSEYDTHSTSGSTGQPMQVRKYIPYYMARHNAVRLLDAVWQQRDLTLPLLSISSQRPTASFNSTGEPFNYIAHTGSTRVVNVSNLKPAEILQAVVDSGAKTISLNGFILNLLIAERRRNPELALEVREFLTFADHIHQHTRDSVKELFNAKLTDRYSCEEFGFLAVQCPHANHLHALPFHNFIEIVDDEGIPCPPGVPGRVLVSSLTNLATPMFRYELGDYAQWGDPCKDGILLPVIEPTITRARDTLVDPSGVSFRPVTGKAEFLKFKEITDFQLYIFNDTLVALVAGHSRLNSDQKRVLTDDLHKMFRSSLPVEVLEVESIEWLGTWKRRLFLKSDQPYSRELNIKQLRALS
jgi:phenylacetate-CoA ligase